MGLQNCDLCLNRMQKELRPHGTLDFPCAGYCRQYSDKPEDAILWHWHEEMEMVYVKNGALRLQIPAKSYDLKEGDCAVINSSILHYAAATPRCELHSLVFSPHLIAGDSGSVYAKKYIAPLNACAAFDGYLLKAADYSEMIRHFVCAFEALAGDAPGFEFTVRENLSQLCLFLYRQFAQEIREDDMELNQDNLRVKKMLNFIHSNFSDTVTLTDIAATANIGDRECLRCFKRTIQLSPIQYLLKYRVMRGAELLTENTADSVSEIAALCGFESPSNFSSLFKRFYHCTPREYRAHNSRAK